MIISFTNVIGAIQSLVKRVITDNLKMWLGFQTSETLGREEVVNGDFATDSDWTKENGWSIANGLATRTNVGSYTALQQNVLESGKVYQVTFTIDSVTSGEIFGIRLGTNYILSNKSTEETFTGVGVANATTLSIMGNPTFAGSISNISIKELTQITPDKSGNNNVGELFTGKALDFNGSTDYVTADGFAGTLSDNTAFTIVMWFKSNQVSQAQPYQNIQMSGLKSDGETNVFKFGASANSTLKGIHYQDTAGPSNNYKINDTVNYNDDIWHRLVITRRSGTNPQTANFYVDGVNIGNCPSQIVWSDLAKFSIGQEYDSGNTPSDFFKGLISDVQIYDKDWLQADVTYDYANPQKLVTDRSGTSIALSNLKGYWAMSEGAGSLVYDSSGEGNNGTINGATYELALPRIPQLGMMNWAKSTPVADEVTLIPNPNNTSQDILGNAVRDRLNSFNLDGSGYAEVADDTDLNFGTGAFTMECWVKADFVNTGSGFNNIFILGGEIADTDTASISINSTKLLGLVSDKTLTADNNYTIGDWYHVCVTRDDSNLCTLYIDAQAQADTETTSASITNTSTKLIGRDTLTTRFYKNLISDVRLYKGKALSASEIENNYNAGLSAHTN